MKPFFVSESGAYGIIHGWQFYGIERKAGYIAVSVGNLKVGIYRHLMCPLWLPFIGWL